MSVRDSLEDSLEDLKIISRRIKRCMYWIRCMITGHYYIEIHHDISQGLVTFQCIHCEKKMIRPMHTIRRGITYGRRFFWGDRFERER